MMLLCFYVIIVCSFFDYTDIHKKCKCGRILGHPPVYDDSRCGRYMQTYDTESNNNHSKIKKKYLKRNL